MSQIIWLVKTVKNRKTLSQIVVKGIHEDFSKKRKRQRETPEKLRTYAGSVIKTLGRNLRTDQQGRIA